MHEEKVLGLLQEVIEKLNLLEQRIGYRQPVRN